MSVHRFHVALVVSGVGWNFGFTGATDMLAGAVAPDERAVVQGTDDTMTALASTICVFASGAIVTGFGWMPPALSSPPIPMATLLRVINPEGYSRDDPVVIIEVSTSR